MSTRETVKKYHLIINKLRKSPATLTEIQDFLQFESEIRDCNFKTSPRTFKRDCEDIAEIYGIDIVYDFSLKAYKIDDSIPHEADTRIMEAFDVIDAFSLSKHLSEYVLLENRKTHGTQHLCDLLRTIKNRTVIRFGYKKYYEFDYTLRTIEPFALKEFKNRWYVLGKDLDDSKIKTFALDRLQGIEITQNKYSKPIDFSPHDYFNHCFGIVNNNTSPQEVVISCSAFQGKYFKSLPLHSSQEIVIDSEDEFRFKITVQITFDFVFELLSFGANITILSPDNLIAQLQEHYTKALK